MVDVFLNSASLSPGVCFANIAEPFDGKFLEAPECVLTWRGAVKHRLSHTMAFLSPTAFLLIMPSDVTSQAVGVVESIQRVCRGCQKTTLILSSARFGRRGWGGREIASYINWQENEFSTKASSRLKIILVIQEKRF